MAEEYVNKESLAKHIDSRFGEISTPFVVREIRAFPTADVAPKSEVEFWQDTAANAKKEILLEIESLALSKIPEDVNVEMLKDTYYIEAIDELMIKYGVTDKNVGRENTEEKE